jgi:hypothetical protein
MVGSYGMFHDTDTQTSPAFPPQRRRWFFIAVSINRRGVVFEENPASEHGRWLTNTGPQTIGNMRQRSISNRGDPLLRSISEQVAIAR